jgi:alpha 1,2-mannosyltransferase
LDDAFDDQPHNSVAGGLFNGEGVVTVAGGEYFGPAIVGIKILRETGSNLPVEAFLANEDEWEPELCEKILPSMNAVCLVLTDFLDTAADGDDSLKVTHYQLKSLALLFSSFQHVLYLDSDSIPLVDPSRELFQQDPYITTGFVGFPDFWIGSESPTFYRIAGMSGFPEDLPIASSEAGQLLVNKNRHLKTLLLAAYYNIYGPDWYYPLLSQGALGQGDKCTFETAAIVLGQPWYRVKTIVKAVGRQTSGGQWQGSGMIQWSPKDDSQFFGFRKQTENSTATVKPAFLHANTPKMNAGHLVDEGDLVDPASGLHMRLWGDSENQVQLFGFDLEKATWLKVVETGCELSGVIREWKERDDICGRAKNHFTLTFGSDPSDIDV